jgi:predicted phosphodiesterase
MLVAALYDIHGNLPALEAAFEELHTSAVDLVVVGGDAVLGPMPRETLEYLLAAQIPVQFIQGNCEREMLTQLNGETPTTVPPAFRPILQWVGDQLTPEQRQFIASWPVGLQLEIPGLGDVLFCHATPRSDTECFTRDTAEARLRPVFDGLDVAAVICGHTHMQFDRIVGRMRVINAGSVGMPFGEPGAYWLLLGPGVQHRRSVYDLGRAAERILATDYPQANEFASQNVLQPPSEERMLEVFAKAELQ